MHITRRKAALIPAAVGIVLAVALLAVAGASSAQGAKSSTAALPNLAYVAAELKKWEQEPARFSEAMETGSLPLPEQPVAFRID